MNRRPSTALAIGGASGVASLTLHFVYLRSLGYYPWAFEIEHWIQLLPYLVFFSMGALPAALLTHDKVVTPLGLALFDAGSWVYAEMDPGPGDPVVGYAFFTAPIVFLLMLVFWRVELRLRRAVVG